MGECCGQESGSSSCQVLNLPQTWGTNSISLSTFCWSSVSGAAVRRSGPSPWRLAPFPLASQNICSLSMSWVGKLLWGKTHLGESPSWHLHLVHTAAQRWGEQRTGGHLCSQQQHGQASLLLGIESGFVGVPSSSGGSQRFTWHSAREAFRHPSPAVTPWCQNLCAPVHPGTEHAAYMCVSWCQKSKKSPICLF